MTEKYILTGNVQYNEHYKITDTENNYAYKNNKIDKQKLCDLLNHLSDENKYLKQRLDEVLAELYCKDRKLEELGVNIECCDKR